MERLSGRVAVVTGAASGIGLAIAAALAGAGATVVMTDLNPEALDRMAEPLLQRGMVVETAPLDVVDPEATETLAAHVVARHGALHIAVNNAGIVNGGLAWELSLEEWRRVLDVDLWGVVHGVRAFVPRILATGEEGHVVNIASMAALHPQARLGPYTVAKHGVLGLSDVLRADLAAVDARVGVSVVMPGMIRTALNPFGRVDPSVVATNVVDAIRHGRPYVYTDDHSTDAVRARLEAILTARHDVIA